MTCCPTSALHDGLDPRPVRLGLSRTVRVLCAGCRQGAADMGLTVRVLERRVADVPVAAERRVRRPAWLARLVAVDRTGEVLRP